MAGQVSLHRVFLALAILLTLGSIAFLFVGTDLGDDAALLGAVGLASAAIAVYAAVFMPAPQRSGNDVFENVLWGKLFVAAVYASIALATFVAMTQTTGYGKLVHVLHALV